MGKRNLSVDVLKTVGILCVILAHTAPQNWLFHVRVFDVCMLVFASGITLKYHGKTWKDYVSYLVKRFVRLIVATWIFLVLYFGFSYLMSLKYDQWSYTLSDYIKSFTFTGGIDYIWIIRVYFLMAILSPVIVKLSQSPFFQKYWLPCLAGMLLLNQALGYLSAQIGNETLKKLFQGFAVYTLGYAIIEVVACACGRIRKEKLLLAATIAFFIVWAISGWASPQTAKYPPQALYLLYGLTVSLALFCLLEKWPAKDGTVWQKAIQWFSRNSLSIYFGHIFAVMFIAKMGLEEIPFVVKYLCVLAFACAYTAVENLLKGWKLWHRKNAAKSDTQSAKDV